MNLDVRTTPEADDQVRVIDNWWQRHRIAARTLFLDELEAAPGRVLLPRTRYHVDYVPREGVVFVLAVWHARRGSGPPLRLP